MSNQIFSGVQGIEIPNWEFTVENAKQRIQDYKKACDKYTEDVKAWCKKHGKGKNAGDLVRFQVADGYAEYVIYSLRPVKLVHLNIMDGYQSPLVDGLTASKIKELAKSYKKLQELFGNSN